VVSSEERICFAVRNRSTHRLRVTLLNAAASGKVQLLGEDVIEAGATRTFWAGGTLGSSFQMTPPHPRTMLFIDRVVAIGRTNLDHDLDHLRTETTFSDAIAVKRGGDRIFYDGLPLTRDPRRAPPPLEHWTSAQAVVETHTR
jgi:hypothetical protein